MTDHDNRRRDLRLPGAATLFIELRAACPDGSHPAEILACLGQDLSAGGLQLLLDRPLVVGSILRIGADFGGGMPPLYVVAEVRWSRPAGDAHAAGLALFDSAGTDIVAWKRLVAGRLAD